METRTKTYIAFALCMALAAGIYLWAYPLNRGKVAISAGMPDALVKTDEGTIQCAAEPCVISLTAGIHSLTVQKDGFFPEVAKVAVKRLQTEPLSLTLKKIPGLKESQVVPAEEKGKDKPLPGALEKQGVVSFAWDSKGEKMVYLDPADEKLKLWLDNASKTVTPLKGGISPMRLMWAPAQNLIVGVAGRDLYRIDPVAASKKKAILAFDPTHFLWSDQGSFILVNNSENKVYRLENSTLAVQGLDLNVDLSMAAWGRDGKLVYTAFDKQENRTTVKAYDLANGLESEITAKFDFPISKIITDANGSIYFFNDRQQNWFLLDY